MVRMRPDEVHSSLSRNILADGFELVVDLDRSHGCRIHDSRRDREILDMFSCFATMPIGWNHPELVAQEARLGRTAVNNITNSDLYSVEMAEAIETIGRLARPDHFPHMFFIAGGALGVENCLKAAMDWKQQDRTRKGMPGDDDHPQVSIAHLEEAFHGRSGYTLSLTNTDPIKTDRFVKFDWPRITNPTIHFPIDETESARLDEVEAQSLEQLRQAAEADPDSIAGVIVEPIQGEGGDNHFRDSYLRDLQRTTHDIGALFIVDEVQTGMGLTGSMWAYEQMGIEPDLLAFGKKMQVCGMMGGPRLLENEDNVFTSSGRINSTWGGNLIDMVRSSICLEVIEKERLVDNAHRMGEELLAGLGELAGHHEMVSNVRGRGLFTAFTLPSSQLRDTFHSLALEADLLTLKSGTRSIRLRPSLNISADEVAEALGIFEQTAKALEADQVA